MKPTHLEFLVEEPSMEAFLRGWLPRVLPPCTLKFIQHRGKQDLLRNLEARLRGYAAWLPTDRRIIVLVDRDDDDCLALKARLEQSATKVGLRTRSSGGGLPWQVVNRIAIEELEAWYFGDWEAVRAVFPRMPDSIPARAAYRHADAIKGGTAQTLEHVLQEHGYCKGGLQKIPTARAVGQAFDPGRCQSPSFRTFHAALVEAVS